MAVGLVILAACSQFDQITPFDEKEITSDDNLVQKVIFEVPNLIPGDDDDPNTRASHVPNGDNLGFAWEATDTVGIYPDKGSQVFFSMEKGVGTNIATFDGGGWALRQNATYSCYYPFIGDMYLDRDHIPVSFTGQIQKNTTDLSNALYVLASKSTSSSGGSLRFTFENLNTIIRLDATLPAGTYTKASLRVEDPLFITKGTYSLADRAIQGQSFSKILDIKLLDFSIQEESTVHIYISSAPVNLKDKEVTVRVYSDDGVFECKKYPSREYLANKWYYLTCPMEKLSGSIIDDNPEGAVDLGLSVLWADSNVGASKPEEYGDYFAWGEVTPKSNYDWKTYEWGKDQYTKYCLVANHGAVDNITSLELRDDAAANERGIGWRMPSFSEVEELMNDCDWIWTDSYEGSGTRGFIVRGRKEGYTNNSIFLPAGGFMPYSSTMWKRERLLYWTRDIVQNNDHNAWYLIYYDGKYELHDDGERRWGKLVRPVFTGKAGDWIDIRCLELEKDSMTLEPGESEIINVILNPSDATIRRLNWSSSDESVATVDQAGIVKAIANGNATIQATTPDGKISVSCSVTVMTKVEVTSISLNKNKTYIEIGNTEALQLTIEPEDATDKTVDWVSSNPSIATVDDNGTITAISEGYTTISANIRELSASCMVYVVSEESNYLDFIDNNVKNLCLENWDTDGNGKLSYTEAANVKSLGTVFNNNTLIVQFEELQFFTGLDTVEGFRGCTNLTTIILPETIKSIGDYAFYECPGLTNLSIPNEVVSIGESAFCYCTGLNSIVLPESVISLGTFAFAYCTNLTNLPITNNITTINSWAFKGCTALSSIVLPDSVTTIGNSAFEGCTNITSITFSNVVTSIGNNAFKGCSSLNSMVLPESVNNLGTSVFRNCSALSSITLPQTITKIPNGLFQGCTNLANITIPSSVISIGENAFDSCSSLTSIVLPQSITIIPNGLFKGCTHLENVSLPNAVSSIGNNAFDGCSALTSMVLPQTITKIPNGLFQGCTNLANITIPSSVISIGDKSFYSCYSLTSINIPDSVTSIGQSAFGYCRGLSSVLVPRSVSSVGSRAFEQCTGMISYTFLSVNPPVGGELMFMSISPNYTIYVPAESVDLYREAQYWSNYKSRIQPIE